jgi:aryl-alcohol dehydrogenase-like predicted oxidoreductase
MAREEPIPTRPLGRTGERVSIIGLGGFHIGRPVLTEFESIRIIRTAIDRGITFLDNCWDYNNGASETRMGKALRDGYREQAFLMTKIDGRDRLTAERQLKESCTRLMTDRVDLLQFHEIIRLSDPDRIFAEGGAMEAVIGARDAGTVRYIGFTGHKNPAVHRKMLDVAKDHGFRFDTVQMPLNLMDTHYRSFEKRVLPELVKENTGILGMKPMGDQFILESGVVTPVECLHYALNLPVSTVITGCDSMAILQQALDAARSFSPLDKDAMDTLRAKTFVAAQRGVYERYKTTSIHDGTYHNPAWLGP